MRTLYSLAARQDLLSAAAFLEEQRLGLADRFLEEVEKALKRIAARPKGMAQFISARTPADLDVRYVLLDRFPYILVYDVTSDRIIVHAIVDARRDLSQLAPRFDST
jgi:plasmid stabilization system protein ParE